MTSSATLVANKTKRFIQNCDHCSYVFFYATSVNHTIKHNLLYFISMSKDQLLY